MELTRLCLADLDAEAGRSRKALRLLGATVPALYGPSADEKTF